MKKIILEIPFITHRKLYTIELDDIHIIVFGNKLIFPYLKSMFKDKNKFIKDETIFRINSLSQQENY